MKKLINQIRNDAWAAIENGANQADWKAKWVPQLPKGTDTKVLDDSWQWAQWMIKTVAAAEDAIKAGKTDTQFVDEMTKNKDPSDTRDTATFTHDVTAAWGTAQGKISERT